ncbi:hypothetical protein [Methylobacterium isbiliense]|nr:hypothetical protein [Methylobacterium isbiliense]MDN3627978.1 hypothetical protein [Methylobacterium isbiliense]
MCEKPATFQRKGTSDWFCGRHRHLADNPDWFDDSLPPPPHSGEVR